MKLKLAPRNGEAAILGRLTLPDEPAMSPGAARGILALKFDDADTARMNESAAKARAGNLTALEQEEVEAYGRIGSLLGALKSKARRSLRGRPGTTKTRMSRIEN
jgi:hypothetical protein